MRDHEDGQIQALLKAFDQFIELCRRNRVQTGRRFVQKYQLRVQRQRAGQTGALAHAAGQLGGIFACRIQGQTDQRQLHGSDLVHQLLRHVGVAPQRHLNVLGNSVRTEQGAFLEQHAPAQLQAAQFLRIELRGVLPEHLDKTGFWLVEADDRTQQHRFAGSRTAHDSHDLTAAHIEIEPIMDTPSAQLVHQPADADDRIAELSGGTHRLKLQNGKEYGKGGIEHDHQKD